MIPPTGVTGSFLTGVLFEHDGKPIEKAQVTISSNGYQFETKLKGEFKIPVSKVDTVVLPLKINSGSRTVVTDLGLPADMIAPVALARVNAGLPVPVGATLPSSSGSAAGNPDASLQSRTLGMQLPANSAPADVKQPTVVYSIPVQTASSAKSVGAFNKSGILISNTSVRLNWDNMFAEAAQINIVFARTAAELSGWDGRTESIPAWPDAPPGGTIISDYSKCSDAQFRSFDNGSLTALNDAKCGFVREAFPFNLNSDVFVRVVGESASELKLSAVFKVSPVEISKPVLSIATISPQSIPENSAPLELSVAVNEAGTNLACASVLTVQSSNQTLLPNQNISLTGTAPSCKITLTPALKKSGTSEVTLVADNGFMSASSAFLLTVTGTQPAGPRPQPVLTVLNAAADKLINEAEKSLQTQVVELSGGPFTTQGFAIVSEVTVCDAAVIYTAAVPTAARTAVGQMSKKICVRTEDSEGNVSFAQSEVVAVEPTTFTSLVWANGAADGFINAADAAANLPIATLSATGYITANYTLVSTSTLCNGSITYNKASVPTSNDASLVDGNSYKLCVKLADGAGNVTYGASASQISVDKTAPNLTITTPLAGSSVSSLFNVQGTCEVGLSVIASVVDGGTTSSITCSGSNTYLIPLSLTGSDGSKTISVSATDGANQTTLKTVSVVKDATSPTVTISAPSVAQVNQSGRLTYSVSFSDLNGIQVASLDKSKITLTATGSALCSVSSIDGAGTTADPFIVTISNCANDGTVGISVASSAATDLAGNSSQLTTSATSVIVDNTAPTPTITSPAADTVFNSATVNTALTGDCENGRTVTLGGDVTAGQTTSCTGTPGAYSFSSWTLTNGAGTKSVTVSQTDAAGNTGTSLARSFTLSFPPSAPTLTASNVSGLKGVLAGTCDSAATSHTATTTLGVVRNVQCTDGTLTVFVHLPEGSSSFSVTATSTNAVGSASSSPVVFTRTPFFCPVGYVGVPGKFATDSDTAGLGNVNASANNSNAGLDPTRDFCVMKYPAKVATSNSGGQQSWEPVYDGNKIFTMANYWPESRADSTPWVNISRDNSIDRCKALNEAYGHCSGAGCYSTFDNTTWGYRLMSNTQWQVIARNLESTGANWTSGTVGTGFLWRGHSDNTITSATTNLLTQTYNGATQLSLSNPKSDAGNSDYFGTGNNLSQNTNGTAGWQERRRFVLSNGTSVWDMAGNVWQWVSDDRSALGIPAADDTAGMSTNGWYSYLNGSSNRFSATGNLIFGNLGSGGLQFSEGKNAGQLYGGSAGAVLRGGYWSHTSSGGLFAAYLRSAPTSTGNGIGFRCVFLPPPLTGPLDTGAPTVAVQRVDAGGVAVANNSVTVSAGGFWNLGISVSDAENTGTRANLIRVKVRRKIATSSTDFPSATDPIYKSGFNLTSLPFETAWELNSTTNQYTRNDGTYVNYLVTAIDPAGNTGSATFSVQNTKSCPPGYVGVPGNGTAGLGNANATVGNANASLDPSREFCVMKYPAKVMSAGTAASQNIVGGLFEPIMNGNNTFSQNASGGNAVGYSYTNSTQFDASIQYLPESRSSGTPWVNINRNDAISACRAQQMQYLGSMPDTTTGTGFQLMSNTQWQVVARNAEAQAVNWSNNAVGNGVLNRGHSDNGANDTNVTNNSWSFTSPGSLANSISDLNSYFATGNTATKAWNAQGTSIEASSEQKRTHTLSNGAVTWDMAGNVWQWVSDDRSALGIPAADDTAGMSTNGWYSYLNGSSNRFSSTGNLIFGNLGSGGLQFSEGKNAGQLYGGSAGAVLRGGCWVCTSVVGLFTARLYDAPAAASSNFGFRCVFLP